MHLNLVRTRLNHIIMDDKNFLESSGEWLLKNSGRALLMGKDPVSVTLGVATAAGQVVAGGTLLGTGKLVKLIAKKIK